LGNSLRGSDRFEINLWIEGRALVLRFHVRRVRSVLED
jgi:hypothetical protein